MVLLGIAIPWTFVAFTTLMQRRSPGHLIGRVSATVDVLLSTPQAISLAVGSLLVSLLDYRTIFWIIAVVMTLGALQIAATLRDQIRADVRHGGTPERAGPRSPRRTLTRPGADLLARSNRHSRATRSCTPITIAAWPLVLPMTDGRRSAAAARRRAREKEIIAATRALFDEKGVREAQIEDIAHAVGINRAIVYRHFSGKEELFALTLVSYLDELHEALESADDPGAEAPPAGSRRWSARSSTTAWPTRRSSTAPRR